MGMRDSEAERDAACIRRSRGDPAAFGPIFSRHGEAVYRYLSRRAEGSAVDDLHAETFVTAFRSRFAYDLAYPDARPWLFGIATHVVHHHRRPAGRRLAMVAQVAQRAPAEQDTLDPAADVATRSELGHQLVHLRAVLPQVEEIYLDVLMLFTGPQLSNEEIARSLSHLHAAMRGEADDAGAPVSAASDANTAPAPGRTTDPLRRPLRWRAARHRTALLLAPRRPDRPAMRDRPGLLLARSEEERALPDDRRR